MRFLRRAFVVIVVIYGVLHFVLASSPVQKRVLSELQALLEEYGYALQIESIELSFFSPKIYLNRVSISSKPNAPVKIATPLKTDKIKFSFSPLSLLTKAIVIDEVVLYHPTIYLESADKIYHRIDEFIQSKVALKAQSPRFNVIVRRIGVIDALFDVRVQDPAVAVQSSSLTFFITQSASRQQTVTVESNDIQVRRKGQLIRLAKTDVDIDFSGNSVRLNRFIVAGEKWKVQLKGATAFAAFEAKIPDSFTLNYQVEGPLGFVNGFKEYNGPPLEGLLRGEGNLKCEKGVYSGIGSLEFSDLDVKGNHLGGGHFKYDLSSARALLTDVDVVFAGGKLHSDKLEAGFQQHYPVKGDVQISGFKLEGLLQALKVKDVPLTLLSSGTVQLGGSLSPLAVEAHTRQNLERFTVFNDHAKSEKTRQIIELNKGELEGDVSFRPGGLQYNAQLNTLGGVATSTGDINFSGRSVIHAHGENLSLKQLKHISVLSTVGQVNANSDIEFIGNDVQLHGNFTATGGELEEFLLGDISGEAFFRNGLLSFENLEASAMEPVRGRGYVDFVPKDTEFKFELDARRMTVDQVFAVLSKKNLTFEKPTGGEASGKVTIEGGGPNDDISVSANGTAKQFSYYDEFWASATYDLLIKPEETVLKRALLMKKAGGIEAEGTFNKADSKLRLASRGLRLEELDHIGDAPLEGELVGELTLQGDLSRVPSKGSGEVKLVHGTFRGDPMPDLSVKLQTHNDDFELIGSSSDGHLNGRYFVNYSNRNSAHLDAELHSFNLSPVVSFFMKKEIPSLLDVTASGAFSFNGDFNEWSTVSGKGEISEFLIGLKSSPMRNKGVMVVRVEDGNVLLDRSILDGVDSQIAVAAKYFPSTDIQVTLDGKIDMQYLQPFVPGLDYATGKIAAGIRVSGKPSKFEMIGNAKVENGTFRLTGLTDEFRNVKAQVGISQNSLNIDRFESTVNGGVVLVDGFVDIARLTKFAPHLKLSVNHVPMKYLPYLSSVMSGEFTLDGENIPYLLRGSCDVHEVKLTQLTMTEKSKEAPKSPPALALDLDCAAKNGLFVQTDVMIAEFGGKMKVMGPTTNIGMMGDLEVLGTREQGASSSTIQPVIFINATKFDITSGQVKFESPTSIRPRFNISAHASVKDQSSVSAAALAQEYEITMLAVGTPDDYKIKFTSSPSLAENDIMNLLVLGTTNKTQTNKYMNLGTTLMGQVPVGSKIQDKFGLDVKIGSSTTTTPGAGQAPLSVANPYTADQTTSVQIQKEITKNTKLSYSNSIDATIPIREFKIEHMLDDNFSINGTAGNATRATTQTGDTSLRSYGLDVRYRFFFE